MKDRELLESLRKVESIPVKVYGQDGETICFEVQVGLAGVMVPGKGSVERHSLEDREESAWEAADNGTPVVRSEKRPGKRIRLQPYLVQAECH